MDQEYAKNCCGPVNGDGEPIILVRIGIETKKVGTNVEAVSRLRVAILREFRNHKLPRHWTVLVYVNYPTRQRTCEVHYCTKRQ
ncbi:hypothetical protein ACHAWF_006643 [Thalassiosira exigua]